MQKIQPFLWFDTQAEEAANFYVSVFGQGSKIGKIARYGDTGPGPAGSVMTVEFELRGQSFVALNAGPHFKFNEAISFLIHCESQAEVDHFWQALTADGGQESQCGWLKDRFGLSWQVVPTRALELWTDADPARKERAFKAMMTMKKLDLAALVRAADGK
jgi:predicted 3-demethylubiquinone-9 3-methyltransferase (glyoxalase superfamily)